MALDRRITLVQTTAPGVGGSPPAYIVKQTPIWAEVADGGSREVERTIGAASTIEIQRIARFTIRWTRDLEGAVDISLFYVIDEYGHPWDVESIASLPERRRYIEITASQRFVSPPATDAPLDDPSAFDLGPTRRAGIRRFAATVAPVDLDDYYGDFGGRRFRATFTDFEVVTAEADGPRSTFVADPAALTEAEINASGGPVGGTAYDGRTFDAPETRPDGTGALYFAVYWIDREEPGERDNPNEIESIERLA